jgi:hypothetical protein
VKNAENAGQMPSESQPNEQRPSLLVVKCPQGLELEDSERIRIAMEPIALALGAKVVVADGGADVQLYQDLIPLIAAITAQTEAITRLAMSNEALVAAMAEEDPDMLELPVRQYMDGSPIR